MSKQYASLTRRADRMQYPLYQQDGWPIGSGIVESGHKAVMQARLKGAGMHWAPCHINPMLALRTDACNDRWDEAHQQIRTSRREQRDLGDMAWFSNVGENLLSQLFPPPLPHRLKS
jgi:hypothetical protein